MLFDRAHQCFCNSLKVFKVFGLMARLNTQRSSMKRIRLSLSCGLLISHLWLTSLAMGQFEDKTSDLNALPKVPPEFEITLVASEPLVRQPCSMAFDERGRLFVGMGPQYRSPTPDTPGDSVVIVQDSDGDGRADQTQTFATGFNAIQGLAWHGRDLWIANAPDLTIARDLNGDDEADEYIKVYTDLGNLEHGLHGLNWAPDGKLYMSKGNSKGLNQPGRYAPRPFRDLWGLTAPADVPDIPSPVKFSRDNYRREYHDPADDWGLDGGVLRCDDDGKNLEIVARGFRNPWDINFDSGFNWIGTDNDQTTGDRVIMPFFGAHFGWNHPWSSHWGTEPHAPTAPVSGPLFEGSGTGVVFCQSPQFPPEYRGVFLINDWLLKATYLWRPQWDGAIMRPAGGGFTAFIEGGSSLFRPTDMEFGPDGALWVLGWSSGYGAEWKDGQLTNEGRIYRVAWKDAPPADQARMAERFDDLSIDEWLQEFDSPLPVRRINAQDELVQQCANNKALHTLLLQRLTQGKLPENQETWTAWTLGRTPTAVILPEYLQRTLQPDSKASLNLQVQSVRIMAYRAKQFSQFEGLADCLRSALQHSQARVRFAGVQAVQETGVGLQCRISLRESSPSLLGQQLLEAIQNETDSSVFYAGWQALRVLVSENELRDLLIDSRAAIRRAALLSLLETHAATPAEVRVIAEKDVDAEVRSIAERWLSKSGENKPNIAGRSLQAASSVAATKQMNPQEQPGIALVRNISVKNGAAYKVVPGGFNHDALVYIDRSYRLSDVPTELAGADLIQTANEDDNSMGMQWLSAEALLPVRVLVGIDDRQKKVPDWLLKAFQKESFTATIDEGSKFVFYSRTFDAGRIELGGNTDDGHRGGKGNYIVAIAPLPLAKQETKTTVDAALELIDRGDRDRGELLFRHTLGAGCAKCHGVDQATNGFGPSLSGIGLRSNALHLVQSIVEPSAVITEGFNQLTVATDEGQVYSGVLLEESGLTLSLGQPTGERIDIPKDSIEARKTSSVSAMPDMSELLAPQQVADITAYLLSMQTQSSGARANNATTSSSATQAVGSFAVEEQKDRLRISLDNIPLVDFVFRDEKIRRPYFANARTTSGVQVTRNHPPIPEEDAVDHDTMHPGIWLGFGDVSGQDYWRNTSAMEHVRFTKPPIVAEGQLKFSTECRLKTIDGQPLCLLTNDFTLLARPTGWLLSWSATFLTDQREVVFGDQEEMGFGARIATPFIENNGGVIRSSKGVKSAKETWGQSAKWCDYSGNGPRSGGIMLMASEKNFRDSWWHNRDYGVFVANPFGREAMKQGARSEIAVAQGETLKITFGAFIHDHREFDSDAEFQAFETLLP
jgi:putative membrane-bound dehydrogenase-like protein